MVIIDKILYMVYKRILYIKREEKLALFRKSCKCCRDTAFYDSANIVNERNRNSIKLGSNTHIRGEIYVWGKTGRVWIGDECYLGANSYIWSMKGISIGNRVLIAHNCNIFDNDTHPLNSKKRNQQFKAIVAIGQPAIDLRGKEIVIEDDVWVGANCTILKGVTIGKNSIIGTGTIVNKSIPENSIAFGNPLVIKHNEAEDI